MSDLRNDNDGLGGSDTPETDDDILRQSLSGRGGPLDFESTYTEAEAIDILAEGVDPDVEPIVEDRYAPVPEETGTDLMETIVGVQEVHRQQARISAGADHGNVRTPEELDLMAEKASDPLFIYPLEEDTFEPPISRGLRTPGIRKWHPISGGPMMPHWQQMEQQKAISLQIQDDIDAEWDKGNYIGAITGYFDNLKQKAADIPTLDDIVESGEFFYRRGPRKGERKGLSQKVEQSTMIGGGIGAGIGGAVGTVTGFKTGGVTGALMGGLGGTMLGGMLGAGATYFVASSMEEDTLSPFLLRMYSLTEADTLRQEQVNVAGVISAVTLDNLASELASHGVDIQPKLDELNVVATQQLQKIEQDQREGKIRHHVLVDRLGQLTGQSFLEIMQFAVEKPEFRAKLLRDRERAHRLQKPDDLTWMMLGALRKSNEDFGSTPKEEAAKKAYLQAQFMRVMHAASYEGLPEELRRDHIDLEGFKSLVSENIDVETIESNPLISNSRFLKEAARSVLNDESDAEIQAKLDKVSFGVFADAQLWHLLKSEDHNVFPDDAKVRNWAQEHQTATRVWGSDATVDMERTLGRMMMTPTKIGDQVYMPESTFAMLMRMTTWAPSAVAEIDFAGPSQEHSAQHHEALLRQIGWEPTRESVLNYLTPASYDRAHNLGLRDFKAGYFARLAAAIRTGNIGMQPAIADIMRAEGMRPGDKHWQLFQYLGLALDFLVPWEKPYLLAAGKIAGATAAAPRVLKNTSKMPRGHRASMLYAQVAPGLYAKAKGLQDADIITVVHNVILEAQRDLHAKGDNSRPYIDQISREQVDEMLRIAGVEPEEIHKANAKLFEHIRQARAVGMQQGLGVVGTPGVAASRQSPGFQRFRDRLSEAIDRGIIERDEYPNILAQWERQAAVIANDPTIPEIQTMSDFFEMFELTFGRQPGAEARFMETEGPAGPVAKEAGRVTLERADQLDEFVVALTGVQERRPELHQKYLKTYEAYKAASDPDLSPEARAVAIREAEVLRDDVYADFAPEIENIIGHDGRIVVLERSLGWGGFADYAAEPVVRLRLGGDEAVVRGRVAQFSRSSGVKGSVREGLPAQENALIRKEVAIVDVDAAWMRDPAKEIPRAEVEALTSVGGDGVRRAATFQIKMPEGFFKDAGIADFLNLFGRSLEKNNLGYTLDEVSGIIEFVHVPQWEGGAGRTVADFVGAVRDVAYALSDRTQKPEQSGLLFRWVKEDIIVQGIERSTDNHGRVTHGYEQEIRQGLVRETALDRRAALAGTRRHGAVAPAPEGARAEAGPGRRGVAVEPGRVEGRPPAPRQALSPKDYPDIEAFNQALSAYAEMDPFGPMPRIRQADFATTREYESALRILKSVHDARFKALQMESGAKGTGAPKVFTKDSGVEITPEIKKGKLGGLRGTVDEKFNKAAAKVEAIRAEVDAAYGAPMGSVEWWDNFMARVLGQSDVWVEPIALIEYIQSPDKLVQMLKAETPRQRAARAEGQAQAKIWKQAYDNGVVPPVQTAEMLLWSFMSRRLGVFPQESGFLMAVSKGIQPFIQHALDGTFTEKVLKDYLVWSTKTVKSHRASSPTQGNLNAFGKEFLANMGREHPEFAGKSKLVVLHEMMGDSRLDGRTIRREFAKMTKPVADEFPPVYELVFDKKTNKPVIATEGKRKGLQKQRKVPEYATGKPGMGMKVFSFFLLVTGRDDVFVLDRVQWNHFWASERGRFGELAPGRAWDNLYDGSTPPDAEMKAWSAEKQNSSFMESPRRWATATPVNKVTDYFGLAMYEAIEDGFRVVADKVYRGIGEPPDTGIGWLHWDMWQVRSKQSVTHGTAGIPLEKALGLADPLVGKVATQGKRASKMHGVSFGRLKKGGEPVYTIRTDDGTPYIMDETAMRAYNEEINYHGRNGDERIAQRDVNGHTIGRIIPRNFKWSADEFAHIVWRERPGVDKGALDDLIRALGRTPDDAEAVSIGSITDRRLPEPGVRGEPGPEPRVRGVEPEPGWLHMAPKTEAARRLVEADAPRAPEAPAAGRTMSDIPLGPERDAILKAGIKAQDGGADVFEKFLLDTFGTTQGHEGWTLQLQTLRRRELITGPPVSQVTNPDGSIVYRAYHGTYRGLPEAEVKAFGGIHSGTERAARGRLEDTRASAGMGPYGPKEGTVVPVEVRLSKPYGSFDSPISEHELSQLVNIRGKMEALKAQGYDGVIYRNVVEDKGEISVLSFQAKNVVKTPRAPEAPAGREIPPQMRAETAGARTPDEIAEAGRLWREQGTESPYFQRWFGDSKVVDADGKPLVVYHGAAHSKGFEAFETERAGSASLDSGWYGKGFYFSDDATTAGVYAGGGIDFRKMLGLTDETGFAPTSGTGSIASVYLSLRNPYDVGPKPFGVRGLVRAGQRLPDDIHDAVVAKVGFDPSAAKNPFIAGESKTGEAGAMVVREHLKSQGFPDYWAGERVKSYLENPDGFWHRLGSGTMSRDAMTKALKADGFDGILQREANAGTVTLPWAEWGVRTTNDAEKLFSEAMTSVLKEKGYDGVVAGLSRGKKEYLVFDPTQIKSVKNIGTFDPADPRIQYMRDPGKVPMGFFEWNPQTSRYIINLYHNANMGVLWHENGHLLATIMGRKWGSKLFKFFDHAVDDQGLVKLTSRGHEELAEAWRMYRKIRDSRHGPVRRLFDQLWLELRNLYYSLRGQPGALPRQAIRAWDLEFGPDPRIVAYSIEAAKQVTKNKRPRVTVDADRANRIREEAPRTHGASRERRRGRLDEDTVRQQLGLKFETFVDTMPDGTRIPRRRLMKQDVDALDIYEKALAVVLTEKIRTDLGPQKIFRPTRRTMLPEGRSNRVEQSIRARWIQALGKNPAELVKRVVQRKYQREVGFSWREMSELGDHITQADVDALSDRMRIQTGNTFEPESVHSLELVVFNDREAAGFHTLVHEMAAEPMGNRIPDGMLDPDTSFRLVELGEIERVREVMIDVEAGVGARASRRIESIPDTLVTRMMNGFSNAVERGGKWAPFAKDYGDRVKKFFEIPTFGKDYFDDGVRDILETAQRRLGTLDRWVLSTQRRLKGEDSSLWAKVGFNQNGFVALVTDLRRQLTPIVDPGQVRSLYGIHKALSSVLDSMDVLARAKLVRGETLVGLDPDVGGVSVQYIYKKIDRIQSLLGDWYGMTPNERTAVITVREYKLRPPASLTEIELYKLADSIQTIKMGIDVKFRAVDAKGRKLWRMMSGDPDGARASKLRDSEVRDIYTMFYNGDFAGLWDKATLVGLRGFDVNKLSLFDPNKAFLEMVVRMRAEEIMEQLGRDLAEYGLNGELRSLSNFKNIGDDATFDRNFFGQRVEYHIGEIINWRNRDVMEAEGAWEFRKSKGKSPKPKYTGKYHAAFKVPGDKWGTVESATRQITDPYDFMAQTVATDMLYKWGFKFGKGEWEFVDLPDGTKQLMPQMVARELEDALDRAAGVGQAAWRGRAWAYNMSPKHNFGVAVAGGKPTLKTRVKAGIGRIVDLIPEVFPLSTRKIQTGVTIGYGAMPTLPYYGGVIIGLQFQNYMTRGALKASWDAANMLPTMARTVGSRAGHRPDMVGAVMARMWRDGQWRPEAVPVITKDFQIFTADHIAELAQQHGLKSSFIQAESAESLMKKIYEAYPTDVVGKLQQPVKWWQTFKIESATFIDNYIRLRIFIDELKNGRRPNDAARIAKRTAYDYSELSEAEKRVARNVIMFYSYFRKNADLFWDTAIKNPERIIAQLRLISGSQRSAAEGENEAIVFPEYAGTRAITPTIKSFYNTQRYKGINYLAPYLPVPDMLMIPAQMYDTMFLEGEFEGRGMRGLVGRLNPLIQAPIVSATGMDLYFNRDLNRGNNQVPGHVILQDHCWTGGMLWDYLDIVPVPVDQMRNPVYQEVQGRVIYVARNGKNYWRWKNLNQVAGGGRTANFLWDLDKMNLGYIEAQNRLCLAYLEYTGGGLLQQIGWLDQFRKPMAGKTQPGFPSVLRGKGPIEDWAEPGSPYYDTAWPRPGMSKVVGQRVPARYAHLVGLPPDDAIAELRASYPTDDGMMSSLDAIDVPGLTPREKSGRLMALYGVQTTVDPSAPSWRELPALFGFRPLFQQHQREVETQILRRQLRMVEDAARQQRARNEKTEDR